MNPPIRALPSGLEDFGDIAAALAGKTPAVFLDYDGTLTPIVEDPQEAVLTHETREAIKHLAAVTPVAVVSGRDLDDVRSMVAIDGIAYAGSHGFDIFAPDGERHERAAESLAALQKAQAELERKLAGTPGAEVERKRFAVAVHYRRADAARVSEIEQEVDAVAAAAGGSLRKTGGKKIFELRPNVDWDKGRALLWLLDVLGLDRDDVIPLYIGDDVTDEDAFEAIHGRGLGIVVRGEDDERETAAAYALDHPDNVRALLGRVAALQKSL